MTTVYADQLARLLDVTPAELSTRANELFERESGLSYPAPLVLCGAGRLGRMMLGRLRSAGAEVLALADNNPQLHGQTLHGCDVVSVGDAVRRHRQNAAFVVTIYTARPLHEQLAAVGVKAASARAVFFQHRELFLPHAAVDWPASLADQSSAIVDGLSNWADDASRAEYVAQIAWHSLASSQVPRSLPASETYFPEGLVRLGAHEVFVDCGAFDGDTLRAFLERNGNRFDRLIAFEPDPMNFEALSTFIGGLPPDTRGRIELRRVAVYSGANTLRFAAADGAGSAVASSGDIEVPADSLDNLLAGVVPTFIKMDIEGAEPNALRGAVRTLRTQAPTLAVCLYHAREHLWLLPSVIRQANADYRIFLRRHSDECWETVAYALPRERATANITVSDMFVE